MNGYSLLVQAMVYLAAGVVSVPIAKRLGLGSVLGYLIAGVLVFVGGHESEHEFAEQGR